MNSTRDIIKKIWRIVEILSILAGITGISVLSLSNYLKPFETVMQYVAIISSSFVLLLLAQLYAKEQKIKEFMGKEVVITGRDAVNQESERLIESARDSIIVIGGDLSWLPKNFERVQRATTERGVKVRILYRRSNASGVQNNVKLGKRAKAQMTGFDTTDDPKIRFLMIDYDTPNVVLLVFKKINRLPESAPPTTKRRDGTPGDISVFEYQAEVYDQPQNRALIVSLSQLFDRMWNDITMSEVP